MKNIIFFILLVSSLGSNAQDNKPSDKILESYLIELKLDASKAKEFTIIYNKYKTELNSKSIENNTFNRLNKERDLELYALLSKEQISFYRKLKKELEPLLNYRM